MTGRVAVTALAVAAGTVLLLPWRRIDLTASGLYYDPAVLRGPWQDPPWIPWGALAHATTFIAIGLALTGLAFVFGRRRRAAIVLLLGLALGPGLLMNVILKDHWHRPRPRQTTWFGGDFEYVPPFRIGPVGKSFPCGHSAVGFAGVALAGLVEARRRTARRAIVAGAILLGAILGLGRIATGAHFASDVVWSALLTFAVLAMVEAAARIPTRDDSGPVRDRSGAAPARPRTGRIAAVAAAGGAALASALLCFPFRHVEAPHAIPLPESVATLDVRIEVQHGRIVFLPPGPKELLVESRHDGFGVPWGRVEETVDQGAAAAGATVRYRMTSRGWFADLEGTTIVKLPASAVERVEIDVADGHLTLIDESGGAALPKIHCRTRHGALRLRGLRPDQIELIDR